MTGNSKATLAAVAAGGYLLGRMKKGKLALTAAVFLAGRRLITDPKQLLTEGLHKLSQTPQFAQLSEQVRGDLMGTGAAVLRSVVDRRVEALCDKIHERTAALQRSSGDGGDEGGEDGDEGGSGDNGGGESGNGDGGEGDDGNGDSGEDGDEGGDGDNGGGENGNGDGGDKGDEE